MQQQRSVKLELIEEENRLRAIEEDWSHLWQAAPRTTPFQSPLWLIPWWQSFHEGHLFTIAFWKKQKLLALLPLYVYAQRESGQRQLLFLGAGTSDYLDGVFSSEAYEEPLHSEIFTLLHDFLLSNCKHWDLLSLRQLRPESPVLHLSGLLIQGGNPSTAESCSFLSATVPSPGKLRRNIGYYWRRAERAGKVALQTAAEENALSLWDKLVDLHRARWTAKGESGVLMDPRVKDHHRRAIPLLARAGLLRLHALTLEEKVIAVFYGLADPRHRKNRSVYYYLNGFDLEHRDLSPGTLLLALALEEARKEGAQGIDLLRGGEEYKELWGAEFRPTYAVEHFAAQLTDRVSQSPTARVAV